MPSVHTHTSLKERQREQREQLILQVAEEVLLEKGYYETSMEEIAARVGISKGTIYLHFRSKEELITAILQRDLRIVLDNLDATIARYTTAKSKFEALLTYLNAGLLCKNSQLFSSIYSGVDLQRKLKEQSSFLREVIEFLFQRITRIIDEGKEAGEITREISTPIIARTFLSLIAPRSYDALLQQQYHISINSDEALKQIGKIFFDGIVIGK
ncbi:TetR/AcrR family transcriptional regulator [Dictyobacter aurantiacus]|uniref:HTH tetR-type domain-containing protein n=1 Tax=Dictyobacter aurantiacus TaxID=1936993 RepID=A0A401ZQ19_9CHLR|nr:TetR/AcrR family transcriptional regulator [Dictyobacter aurantiacus]GCE08910.1 hypothetical protein KDAU_62390 [Dictyobacter aurantiacus]